MWHKKPCGIHFCISSISLGPKKTSGHIKCVLRYFRSKQTYHIKAREHRVDKDHSISHGDPEFFSLSHARDKTKNIFLNSLPSSKLTISTISKGHCVTIKKCIEPLWGEKWQNWKIVEFGSAGEVRLGFQRLNLTNFANGNPIDPGYYSVLFL